MKSRGVEGNVVLPYCSLSFGNRSPGVIGNRIPLDETVAFGDGATGNPGDQVVADGREGELTLDASGEDCVALDQSLVGIENPFAAFYPIVENESVTLVDGTRFDNVVGNRRVGSIAVDTEGASVNGESREGWKSGLPCRARKVHRWEARVR